MEIASYPVSLRCLKAHGVTRLFNGQNENLAWTKRLVLYRKNWKKVRVNLNSRMNGLYFGGQWYKGRLSPNLLPVESICHKTVRPAVVPKQWYSKQAFKREYTWVNWAAGGGTFSVYVDGKVDSALDRSTRIIRNYQICYIVWRNGEM